MNCVLKILYCLMGLFVISVYSRWYDSQSSQATVLLEKEKDEKFETYGTGFLLYNYKNPGNPIVITCGHLLKRSTLFVSLNADTLFINTLKSVSLDAIKSKRIWLLEKNRVRCIVNLTEEPDKTFIRHPKLDIGAFLLNFPFNKLVDDSGNVKMRFSHHLAIPKSGIRLRSEASIGEEVYFVGFPFGIGNFESVEPLVRSGSIAWLSKSADVFLLDAFSYGGNSGSPVFLKSVVSTPGDLSWERPYLIGMIIGHQGIKLENILIQPDTAILKFEKGSVETNWGLATCVWADDILEIANMALNLDVK